MDWPSCWPVVRVDRKSMLMLARNQLRTQSHMSSVYKAGFEQTHLPPKTCSRESTSWLYRHAALTQGWQLEKSREKRHKQHMKHYGGSWTGHRHRAARRFTCPKKPWTSSGFRPTRQPSVDLFNRPYLHEAHTPTFSPRARPSQVEAARLAFCRHVAQPPSKGITGKTGRTFVRIRGHRPGLEGDDGSNPVFMASLRKQARGTQRPPCSNLASKSLSTKQSMNARSAPGTCRLLG